MPRWLDRLWLCCIAGAWLLMIPIGAILALQREPWASFGFVGLIAVSVWGWLAEPAPPRRSGTEGQRDDARPTVD